MKIIETLRTKTRVLFQGFVAAGPGTAAGARQGTGLGIEQSPFLSRLFTASDLPTFFNLIFKSALVIGAMLAVLRLGYAGYLYMTSDVWGDKSKAKDVIQETVLGLLLLLAVWLILNQINPNLLNLDILRGVRNNPASPGGQPLPGSTPIGQGGVGAR
ncbi:MAG: hypothetical protein WA021_04065 [Minisyncoccia bacterium]